MSLDALVDSTQLDNDLEDIADAIRAKSGSSSLLAFPNGFISEIGNIVSGGGTVTEYVTVTTAQAYIPTALNTFFKNNYYEKYMAICADTAPETGYWVFWIGSNEWFKIGAESVVKDVFKRRTTAGATDIVWGVTGSSTIPTGTTFRVYELPEEVLTIE